MNQNNQYAADPNQQVPTRGTGGSTGAIITAVAVVGGIGFLLCCGILVGLMLPAVQAAREAARRMQCQNNMRQVALALLNYETTYGSFPPAYTVDADGQPLHSWRTLILPYMEQKNLYDQIDLSKPWDDPVNQPFNDLTIMTYVCPSTALPPGKTTYVAPIHPQGVFSGSEATKIQDITDGLSNTLLVVEVDEANAVSWMEPNDIDSVLFPTGTAHTGGGNAALADGAVNFISDAIDPVVRDAMVTKDGGEAVGF
ncbi:MAG: DUF1559 domain-containing protein [Planctomycetota bacterium]